MSLSALRLALAGGARSRRGRREPVTLAQPVRHPLARGSGPGLTPADGVTDQDSPRPPHATAGGNPSRSRNRFETLSRGGLARA
jgi:hypothetical protein